MHQPGDRVNGVNKLTLDGHIDANGDFHATLHGVLTLHGAQHDAVIETQGRLDGDYLIATGTVRFPYVKWGLKDPSILFLTVAKEVEIDIATAGHIKWLGSERVLLSPRE